MVCVFPGWLLVRARDFLFIRALISEDLPTLLLPAKATSGSRLSGSLLVIPHTVSRLTFLITIFYRLLSPVFNRDCARAGKTSLPAERGIRRM